MKYALSVAILFCCLLPSFSQDYIPVGLAKWKNWVVKDQPVRKCPSSHDSFERRKCVWPTDLKVSVSKTRGQFSGKWRTFRKTFISLPGQVGQWPTNVKINGKTAIVIDHNGAPSIEVEAGIYSISGEYRWRVPPLRLVLPTGVGLVELSAFGKKVLRPIFDRRGDLWLKASSSVEKESKNFLQIKIFRKISDDIPAIDETILELNVGGAEREVELSSTLLTNFIPLSFYSTLPAKWESSGRLKLRVRPGKHNITLKSRGLKKVGSLAPPLKKDPLPKQEVWVFSAKNNLRVSQVHGIEQIDSNLMAIPSAFKGLPTYLMNPASVLTVKEVSRGMKNDRENSLHLHRTHWLDFSGEKFTVKDQISGQMNKGWRLSMKDPFELGSVVSGSRNRLVTEDQGSESRGVEVRSSQVNLIAESRLRKTGVKVPAVGWDQNFKGINGSFNIPPGWRAVALIGADYSKGTWMSKWSLLSLFFVFVLAIGVFKLRGIKWAFITFFSLVLLIHEENAPYWIWLHLLVSLALERALTAKMKVSRFVKGYRLSCLLVLILISFPFATEQIQKAIYPSLEKQNKYSSFYSSLGSSSASRSKRKASRSPRVKKLEKKMKAKKGQGFGANSAVQELAYEEDLSPANEQEAMIVSKQMEFDPDAQIQTGPGIPNWSWGVVNYGWEGPVEKGQSISLLTLSPIFNRIFTVLRIILLILLIFCFVDLKELKSGGLLKGGASSLLSLALILLLTFSSNESLAQNFPTDKLLKDLREDILKSPSCYPGCIAIERMNLKYSPDRLIIRLRVHAAEAAYFPLPGSRDQWLASKVLLNGRPASAISGENQGLSVFVEKGTHDLVLGSGLGENSQTQITLPLKPKNISYSGSGWSLEGIRENGKIDGSLTLYKVRSKDEQGIRDSLEDLGSTLLPHFVKLERVFDLGLTWTVRTTLSRVSPTGRAINLDIMKVKGERLTSSNVVDNGKSYKVSLAKSRNSITWTSLLEESSSIDLRASNNNSIIETWRFVPGSTWRVQLNGLPKVSQVNNRGNYTPFYRPWADEELKVLVSRPKAASGQAVTLEQAKFHITPGKRLGNFGLDLSFKTSMGVSHSIKLPKDAKLTFVKINGQVQSLTLKEGVLNLPLGVGLQKVNVGWEARQGIGVFFKTPEIDLGLKGINLKLQVRLSNKRWVTYLGGPIMGPAVLFWGKLIALLLVSLLLAKISWSPLNFFQWFLLSIGLTQGHSGGIIFVIGYLLFLCFRKQNFSKMNKITYNLTSLIGIGGALAAVSTFLLILNNGLLGGPQMNIEGNDSSAFLLNWFVDRFDGVTPQAWVLNFPTIAYQILMLLWAIWMTFSLIKWVPWLWAGIYGEGIFKKVDLRIDMKKSPSKDE